MQYINNWDVIQEKYKEYWARENHDRPLISVVAPKSGYVPKPLKAPERLEDRWLDIEYIIRNSRNRFASTYFGGEAFPILNPNLGPDILGAILGCGIEFGEETSWAIPTIENWEHAESLEFNPENKWWKKIKQITVEAVNDAKGDYFVGITDLHAGLDAIVSLRSPEKACMDIYDNPEAIKKATFEILEVFKKVVDELYAITTRNLKGSSNWTGIWHPGKWYVTSCDFICMISQEMFAEFVLPELQEELQWLDASIFHLDGPGALRHLDALLELPRLNGIQWVYGAGQPSASHWIPILKKIQDAGKLIQVNIEPGELDILLEELRPEGVMYCTSCESEDDARDIVAKAEHSYKKKIF